MVAQTIKLPNIRKIFLPDPGYTLIEVDLARADAQVVAWEADDAELKNLFRSGADIHTSNALDIFGGPGPISKGQPGYAAWYHKRQRAKTGVHAVNYGCKEKTLAEHLECSISDARTFISSWFSKHPQILGWHKRLDMDLRLRHCVENKWGYKRHYWDRLENILPEALAWIGQSTVAITTNKILVAIEDALPYAQMLLQVHDSNLFQVPTHLLSEAIPVVDKVSRIPIPYPDPLIIPPTLSVSDKSWGDMNDVIFNSSTDWCIKTG